MDNVSRRALLAFVAAAAAAANDEPRRLGDLSLEDLMQIPITTVERRELSIGRNASAVYIITRQQIERSYAATVPDLLRRVPGLQVAQINANRWAVGGRGAHGRYSNTILVLIDGRSVFSQFTGGVFWEHNDLMVEDIERIEVIRGPGATIWGVNAINGVINIITRKTADTLGTLVSARASQTQPAVVGARQGIRLGERAELRVHARGVAAGASATAAGGSLGDRWRTTQAGGRLEWRPGEHDTIRVQGAGHSGGFHSQLSAYPPSVGQLIPFPVPVTAERGGYGSGFGLLRWDRAFSERTGLAVQTSYQRENRHETLADFRTGLFSAKAVWNTRRAGSEITLGAGLESSQDSITEGRVLYNPAAWRGNFASAFAQYDAALSDHVMLSLGSKFQRQPFYGVSVQPTARLLWNLTARQSLWGAFSRTVRPPTRRERSIERLDTGTPLLPSIQFNDANSLQPERLAAQEIGYRFDLRRGSIDLSAYRGAVTGIASSSIGNLINDSRGQFAFPLYFRNDASSRSWGLELASAWHPAAPWDLTVNYVFAQRHIDETTPAGRVRQRAELPPHQATVISDVRLTPKLAWQQSLYFVDSLVRIGVPAYWRLDTGCSYRLSPRLTLAAGGENLLAPRHLEYVSEELTVSGFLRRSAFVRLVWTR